MVIFFIGSFLNEKEFIIVYFENVGGYCFYMVLKSERMKKYLFVLEMVFDKMKGIMK